MAYYRAFTLKLWFIYIKNEYYPKNNDLPIQMDVNAIRERTEYKDLPQKIRKLRLVSYISKLLHITSSI
jgi:hypothetical protein